MIADSAPPYKLYKATLNHIQNGGADNPFASEKLYQRWYREPREEGHRNGHR